MASGCERTLSAQRGEDDLEGRPSRAGSSLDLCRVWGGDGVSWLSEHAGCGCRKSIEASLPDCLACDQRAVRLRALLQRPARSSAINRFGIDPWWCLSVVW